MSVLHLILSRVSKFLLYRFHHRHFSSSFGIRFLVEECGIPLKLDSPLARRFDFEEKVSGNVKSVISFFKSHGFSEAEIAVLIQKRPLILRSRVSSNLNPKLQYLIEIGFEDSNLRQIVLRNPDIFSRGLNSTIKPGYVYLKTVLGSDERARVVVRMVPWALIDRKVEERVNARTEYLARQGMPNGRISYFLLSLPRAMMERNDSWLVSVVEKVKKLGVMPRENMFLHAVRAIIGFSESTWKSKVDMLKRLGWSDKDVASTFSRQPYCFTISEEKLKTAMEYFVNYMGIPREVIIADPVVVLYSLKERIRPRCGVVKILEAEELLPKWRFSSMLRVTEKEFIMKYIRKHQDAAPHLLEAYHRIKKSDVQEEALEMYALSQKHDEDVVREH